VTVTAVVTQATGGDCTIDGETDCDQDWALALSSGASCNIAGTIFFGSSSLECRDISPLAVCPGNPFTNFTITIGTTDLCDHSSDEIDASKGLTPTMTAFYDNAFTQVQTEFQTGDIVYFQITINDPTSTIDSLEFDDISVANSDGSNPVSLYSLSGIEFQTLEELNGTEYLAAGVDGILEFQFRLLRNIIPQLADLSAQDANIQLLVTATIDITYHGNSKRSVQASAPVGSLLAQSHLSIFHVDAEAIVADEEQGLVAEELSFGEFFSAASSSSVSVFFAVVFGVVAMLAL